MNNFDVAKARQLFVTKVSWGPTRIGFGEAIKAFDEVMAELGFGETVAPSSYSPALDGLSVPLHATSADDLEKQVLAEVTKGKTKKKRQEDLDGMQLDPDQENAHVLENMKGGS